MELLRSIVVDVVCERSMDARKDAVHDLVASEGRNEARGKLKLEEMIMILMIV